ncbi:uncharacterized protein ACR2FA_002168 [Aphomia sociella]
MFRQPPDDNLQKNNKVTSKKRHKRKKKGNQNKQSGVKKDKKKNNKLTFAMSSWAENFASAATWQLKHQVAYWKARAKSLEYENKVLHDIIKKKNYVEAGSVSNKREESEYEEEDFEDDTEDLEEDGDNFEVSEEFIQFLTSNVKYKEEARREKERLKALQEAEENAALNMEEVTETAEERRERLKNLYGSEWESIAALEMALTSAYIEETDINKPAFWPHLPFNLNYR